MKAQTLLEILEFYERVQVRPNRHLRRAFNLLARKGKLSKWGIYPEHRNLYEEGT